MEKIYYSFIDDYPNNVVSSQVIEYIEMLEEKNIQFNVIFLIRFGAYVAGYKSIRYHKKNILRRIKGNVNFRPMFRRKSKLSLIISVIYIYFIFRKHPKSSQIVIHARGAFTARVAGNVKRLFKNIKFVYDIRGDYIAEYLFHAEKSNTSKSEISKVIRKDIEIQSKIIKDADHLFCVSSILKERVISKYGAANDKIDVIPCLADHNKFYFDEVKRNNIRNELGVSNKFVFVYPGGIGYWHYSDKVFEIIGSFSEQHDDIFFIILTPSIDEANIYAEKYLKKDQYMVKSAGRKEVPDYLLASDMGVLLRERHALNEVAAPTKFAEYLMSGLPVLISEYIGDYSTFVLENNLGIVLSSDPKPEEYNGRLSEYLNDKNKVPRKEIAEIGYENFAKEKFIEIMSNIYKTI